MRLSTVWCAALLAAAVPGCKKKDKGEADNSAAKTTTATAPDKGSDMMAAGSSGPAVAQATPPPATGDDIAKRYVDCWGYFSSKDWKSFEGCYSKDVTSDFVDTGMPPVTGFADIMDKHNKPFVDTFPDVKGDVEVTLVNGHNAATVALISGTQSGVMKTPAGDIPASKKKIGLQVAHAVHFTDDGKTVDKEWFYQDLGEMMGQIGASKAKVRPAADKPMQANEIVVAKDDDTEKKNLGSAQKLMDSFNKRDMKGLGDLFDDKLVWSEQGIAKDWTSKADTLKAHEGLVKAFSDVKFSSDAMWAAGDYVAWQGVMAGTNDGAAPDMGMPKATKKPISIHFFQLLKFGKDGKLTNSWGFWNSAAMAMQLGLVPPAKKK